MGNHTKILKKFVEKLGLDKKASITKNDKIKLEELLLEARQLELHSYVTGLNSPEELEDLIVNTIYG